MDRERLWTLAETAAYLGVPGKTLEYWLYRGTAPRSFRVGRYRRFHPDDVRAWLNERASDRGDAA